MVHVICHITMSRYFYILLLSFLEIITLCYSVNNVPLQNLQNQIAQSSQQKQKDNSNNVKYHRRPDYDELTDKEPVSQIDVASFIQQPDEYAIDDSVLLEPGGIKSLNSFNNNDDYGTLLDMDKLKTHDLTNSASYDREDDTDKSPLKMTRNTLNRIKNTRNIGDQDSFNNQEYQMTNMDSALNYNPNKINSMKYLKIPFFSHKSNKTKKIRNKKRKVLGISCFKKDSTTVKTHNQTNKKSTKHTTPKINIDENKLKPLPTFRVKRDSWTDDQERQMKELDILEKKVDSVKITSMNNKID